VRDTGTSSAPQVRQSTTLGLAGGGERKMDASSDLLFASFFEGAAVLTVSRLERVGLSTTGFACEVEALRSNIGLEFALLELTPSVRLFLVGIESFDTASPCPRRWW